MGPCASAEQWCRGDSVEYRESKISSADVAWPSDSARGGGGGGGGGESARIRVKSGGRFDTLLAAFEHCDPERTGYIRDHGRFAEVAHAISNVEGDREALWQTLDQDGNGGVSFPEFVEWAERFHVGLEVGLDDDELGPGGISFPSTWRGPTNDPSYKQMVTITDGQLFAELQQLLDVTYKKVWTRDRKTTGINKVPEGYQLVKAETTENYSDWRRYYLKRHQLVRDCSTGGWLDKYTPLTAQAELLCGRHKLRGDSCNEWLLFHGTNSEAAKKICDGDFTMHLAGTATGTLYGRGTYFGESITKADEYARPDAEGLCCVLVCRVAGGRVLYNDEATPDAQVLQDAVLAGHYHSILGDRERCRGTFKEYIVFDADHVYVEYALYYTRVYDD